MSAAYLSGLKVGEDLPSNNCLPKRGAPRVAWAWRSRILSLLMVILMMASTACQSPQPPARTTEQSPTSASSPTATAAPTDEPRLPTGIFIESKVFSTVLGYDFEYTVYLPAGYAAGSRRYPVIYLLHGRGDTMYGWQTIKPDLDQLIAEGAISPLIAVLPDVPASKSASYFVDSEYAHEPIKGEAVETAFIQDLIPHIDASYRTIAARTGRAIAGYSMGGYGAVRYPLAYPELFSATIILSPAVYVPLPPGDSSARLFGAFGQGEQVFVEEIYTQKNYPALIPEFEKSQLALHAYIAVGDDEWRNPKPEDYQHDLDYEAARLYNSFVHARFIVAQFSVLHGGHDWDVWRPAFTEGLTWIARFLDEDE